MFCVPRTVYAALLHISSPCHATQGCKLDDDTKTWAMPDGRSGIVGGGGRGRGPGLHSGPVTDNGVPVLSKASYWSMSLHLVKFNIGLPPIFAAASPSRRSCATEMSTLSDMAPDVGLPGGEYRPG